MKKIRILLLLLTLATGYGVAQNVRTFEMRYITTDPKANGETDFHGETEWMTLDQRVAFLNKYASFSSRFFDNARLDRKIVDSEEVARTVKNIKPQPLTNVRQTIRLSDWRAYGYQPTKAADSRIELERWHLPVGASVQNGCLILNDCRAEKAIKKLDWRFKLKVTLKEPASDCTIDLQNGQHSAMTVNMASGKLNLLSARNKKEAAYHPSSKTEVEIYGDFLCRRFFVTIDGKVTECAMDDAVAAGVDRIVLASKGKTVIDDIVLFNFIDNATNVSTPYRMSIALDDDFNEVLPMDEWQTLSYDDSKWSNVSLPSVHGGLREKGESYYLRKVLRIDDFERAILKLETLDPGGEVWINGQPVAVINGRHPHDLDVTEYLQKNSDNIIAVRVKPYEAKHSMLHAPSDPYIGWFLGRTELLLTKKCMIKDVFVHTASIGETVIQRNKVVLQYSGVYYFDGSIEVNYYPWFPIEGLKVASATKKVEVRPAIDNNIILDLPVETPKLWSPDSPNLYRVEVILRDKDGKAIDDCMLTTGIRTVEQKNGDLYINGVPEMLNGAQILGSRYPVETAARTNRCVPDETVAQDLMMIKKMNGNLLRIHVHAEKDTIDGINDPRYAEFADQLGVYLLWQTAGWIREGEAWNVDFEGYPKYMRQVYNHPSIVMWEASNHPNRFKKHDVSDSHDYMNRIYQTISSADTSRLISPTSFWQHTHYGNYDGTLDYKGNPLEPNPVLMEKLMTRGSQDAYTGYGATWTSLRKAPHQWAKSCLDSKDKAYFNFEHEESAAQPNWELAVREPWYQVATYEKGYEEGSIGRNLEPTEWKESQAFQAFSAWESMKKQILLGYDGFSWCSLESGANMFTYQKPLVDPFGVPKLAFYTNGMAFNCIWAASDNVDVVYGPNDRITPVIFNLGTACKVNLTMELKNDKGETKDRKTIKNIRVPAGRTVVPLSEFRFKKVPDGYYFIVYSVNGVK